MRQTTGQGQNIQERTPGEGCLGGREGSGHDGYTGEGGEEGDGKGAGIKGAPGFEGEVDCMNGMP